MNPIKTELFKKLSIFLHKMSGYSLIEAKLIEELQSVSTLSLGAFEDNRMQMHAQLVFKVDIVLDSVVDRHVIKGVEKLDQVPQGCFGLDSAHGKCSFVVIGQLDEYSRQVFLGADCGGTFSDHVRDPTEDLV